MKIQVISLITILTLISLCEVFSQPEGSEEFNKIHQLIKPSVIEGFVWNIEESSDSRFQYTFTYDLNGSELNRLIYTFIPNAEEFSIVSAALGGVEFNYNGRKAMYIDGKETGMSGISVLLRNSKGRFAVNHRELSNMSTYSKTEMEQILSKIPLESLEN